MGGPVMESLAILAAIVVFTPFISGLIATLLSLRILITAINSRSKSVALTLTIIRRTIQGFFLVVGFPLACFLLFNDVIPLKFFGLFSFALLYLALHLEYISKNSNFRGKKEPTIYSADGSEIIRAKKVNRLGRSSGRDGHGPGGQH